MINSAENVIFSKFYLIFVRSRTKIRLKWKKKERKKVDGEFWKNLLRKKILLDLIN